jgi:Arc/MetJ-type ribon-helix-helix transcriptional regulator
VGTVNVTVRFGEDELRRLDELVQRMGKTRSDVIRDLISRFDEALREEVEKERRKWMTIGFVGALESAILDPEVILRFVRRNVDILGFPDFLVGMVRVKNRVVLFSHHDRIGSQLLNLVRSKVEEDIKREEAELMQEDDGDEDTGGGKAASAHVRIRGPIKPGTPHAIPGTHRYEVLINSRATAPILRSIATGAMNKATANNGGGGTKAAGVASVSKNQKSGSTGIPTSTAPADSQPKGSGPQANAGGGDMDPVGPVGQVSMDRPVGDFAFALVANLYHKHRENLLRLMEALGGDPNAMAD